MSLLRGGIHGSTLSGAGCEKWKMAMGCRVTDRALGDLSSWGGWRAERLSHRDEEAGCGGRDTWMGERVVGVVQAGGIGDVRRGRP